MQAAAEYKVDNGGHSRLTRVDEQEGIESTPFGSKCCSRFSVVHIPAPAVYKVYNSAHFQLPSVDQQEGIESTPFASKCCSRFSGVHIPAPASYTLLTLPTK